MSSNIVARQSIGVLVDRIAKSLRLCLMKKLCLLLLVFFACELFAEGSAYLPDYLLSYPKTGVETITAPLSWETGDWLILLGTAGALTAAYFADEELNSLILDNRNEVTNVLADTGNTLGESYFILPAIGTTLAGGLLLDSPHTVDTGMLCLKSLILASGTTTILKYATQRRRPDEHAGNSFWNGSGVSGKRDSFPSGHSTAIWSVATVVASQYAEEKWVPPLAYGLATLTCYSRMHSNRHWSSDVLAGAIVGFISGKMTMKGTPRFELYHDFETGMLGASYHF